MLVVVEGRKKPGPLSVGFQKFLFCSGKFIVANLRKPVNINLVGGDSLFENLKRLCRSRGVSLAEVERACGLGKKSIYAWGKNSPSIESVKLAADFLGVTVDDLLRQDSA